ncbi:DUF6931 family protein [Chelatococcus asaccharovorans]|uniref:Uncharacterized protein n=1 Tax=Chelatococcus asaccharovorans TaxID=28210 RepID=A0A2V3UJ94_9HYPH|nr:hypothetical protein [Chelatococcus asaccharovorans]MBS7706450.1 hypothetical protein [Chelatococcus asaccharovorans]PXW64907.1 hypothetical protein C7450_101667 [Chelatococcus asaccharovorans]
MNFDRLFKIADVSPAACVEDAGIAGPALSLGLDGVWSAPAYLARLIDAVLWPDAIRFLAFALPRREGAWWACLSARRALGDMGRDGRLELNAIEAAEAWVRGPCEERRRACLAGAEAVGCEGAAGYAALAAYWTGNLAQPDAPEIPPDARLAPTAVGAAVLLGALGRHAGPIAETYRLAVLEALDIARGGDGRDLPPDSRT